MAVAHPLKRAFDLRPGELPQALSMFLYFFLVITTFWILKPIKKSLFVGFYAEDGLGLLGLHFEAAQGELIAKVGNMVAAFLAATLFAFAARSLHREKLTYLFSVVAICFFLVYRGLLSEPGHLSVWSFYIFGDIYNTLMVGTFFAFLNDSVPPEKAKRLYGLIVLGGVAGGAFGSSVVAAKVEAFSMNEWLWLCIGIALVILVVAAFAGRLFSSGAPAVSPHHEETKSNQTSPATEGARLVLTSRYLMAIAAIVGLYEMISTIMDFQFTSTVTHYLTGPAIAVQFSRVFAFTNWFGLIVQLFLASFVMTRFGVGTALLVLPVGALLGSAGFMLAPVLFVGSALNTLDNGLNYSINQSAKEVLYTPTNRSEKYEAKAFIDMFVQRFAKAIAVLLSLGLTMLFTDFGSLRWLSVFTAVILLVWIQVARFAGKEFRKLTGEAPVSGA